MAEADLSRVIDAARAAVGADVAIPARAERIRYLPRDEHYVLVHLGEPGQPGWIVAVASAGWIMSWAHTRSGASTLPVVPDGVEAEYVWTPTAGRSLLYPLLLITINGQQTLRDLAGVDRPYPARPTRG